MTAQTYLNKLYELKNFLDIHPEQYKIYSDIAVDLQIFKIKKKIHDLGLEQSTMNNDNDIYISDGFIYCDNNPFDF